MRLYELTEILPEESFSPINLELQKPRTVWVATKKVEIPGMSGQRTVAIVMNAKNVESATCVPPFVRVARCVSWVVLLALPGYAAPGDTAEIDYLITNAPREKATVKWIVTTYSQRNWVEVFYRTVKGWLGLKECQVRGKKVLSVIGY